MAPKPASALADYPYPSGGMMSSSARGLAFRAHGTGWQVGASWNNITTGVPTEELKVAKDGPGQCLSNANYAGLQISIVSQEIYDATYILDSAIAGSYKRGATSALSLSARRLQGGECSCEGNKNNKDLGHIIHCEQ
jgi:hypothetical protein